MPMWFVALAEGVGGNLLTEVLRTAYDHLRKRPDEVTAYVARAGQRAGLRVKVDNAAVWWARPEVKAAFLSGSTDSVERVLFDVIVPGTSAAERLLLAEELLNGLYEVDVFIVALSRILRFLARAELEQAATEEALAVLVGGLDAALYDLEDLRATMARIADSAGLTTSTEPQRHVVLPPPPVSPWFIGRGEIIEDLLTKVERGPTRCLALVGPGGVGKSQIAAEVVRRTGHKFSTIAWVDCSSGLRSGLHTFGARVAPPDVEDFEVVQWLNEGSHDCLLVLDGLIDAEELTDCIPTLGSTTIVVTTRDREVLRLCESFVVGPLNGPESVQYLVAASGRLTDELSAQRLNTRLGGLPILLTHAASWVRATSHSFDEYSSRLERGEMASAPAAGSTFDVVVRSWELSLSFAQRQCPAARLLFDAVVAGPPSGLARDIVPALYIVESLGKDGPPDDVEALGATADAALAALLRYSLVDLTEDGVLRVHPLLREVKRQEFATVRPWRQVVWGMAMTLSRALNLARKQEDRASDSVRLTVARVVESLVSIVRESNDFGNDAVGDESLAKVLSNLTRETIYRNRHMPAIRGVSQHQQAHQLLGLSDYIDDEHWRDLAELYHLFTIVKEGDLWLEASQVKGATTSDEAVRTCLEPVTHIAGCEHAHHDIANLLAEMAAIFALGGYWYAMSECLKEVLVYLDENPRCAIPRVIPALLLVQSFASEFGSDVAEPPPVLIGQQLASRLDGGLNRFGTLIGDALPDEVTDEVGLDLSYESGSGVEAFWSSWRSQAEQMDWPRIISSVRDEFGEVASSLLMLAGVRTLLMIGDAAGVLSMLDENRGLLPHRGILPIRVVLEVYRCNAMAMVGSPQEEIEAGVAQARWLSSRTLTSTVGLGAKLEQILLGLERSLN